MKRLIEMRISVPFLLFPQLLPKPYLSAPIVFPFSSRSCGILGTSAAIHRITENGEILSRIMPEQCCWFATQSRCGVSRISDNVMVRNRLNGSPSLRYSRSLNCTAFLDCSHHARDKEWFCQNSMNHSSDVLRQRENYETFASERGDGNYVIIGTPGNADRNGGNNSQNKEFANDTRRQTILKMENGSPKQQNASSGKKNV
ncbi:uncharacterized protein LOC108627599 [Ceratina calcarata]|uniref:Uncharacterized protein LOC108627599 n=1 Tax=Ceratina calcarata TaxID=156304 RepID=A0AAJ7WCY4_9HYME|nr:uncharacterized protein LOC108627599 [Ceratina calcarata]